tara:strand:- start:2091 stop:2759 length:669 start_codon:yes stop_codon:yes gene_type:complete
MFDSVLVAVFTYNEENKISDVLEKICKKFKNILVVDNNSQDNTLKKISNYPVKCIHHKYNLGKSNSMKTALDYARINNFEYLAFIDGDGQHSISDLEKICNKILEIKNGLVIGFREDLTNLNLKKRIGTKILNKIFMLLYKKKISDIQCGLRVFNITEKSIKWESSGLQHYFADAEITCNAIKNGCQISQIPIKTITSDKFKGMNILQGLYLLIMIIVWRVF